MTVRYPSEDFGREVASTLRAHGVRICLSAQRQRTLVTTLDPAVCVGAAGGGMTSLRVIVSVEVAPVAVIVTVERVG